MSYKTMVHGVLEHLGLDAYDCWNGSGWNFFHDQLPVFITADDAEEEISVHVFCCKLPKQNLLPIYRKLLEINLNIGVSKIGVLKDDIVVATSRPIDGMDINELLHLITQSYNVGRVLADDLEKTFGVISLRIS